MSLVCSRLPQSDCLFHVVLGMTHPCACVDGLDVTELEFIGRGRVPLVSLVKWLLKIGDRVVSWRGRLMEERETNPSCLPLRCGSGCRPGFLPHSYGGSHSLPLFHARYLDLHLVSDGCSWDFDLWRGNIVHRAKFWSLTAAVRHANTFKHAKETGASEISYYFDDWVLKLRSTWCWWLLIFSFLYVILVDYVIIISMSLQLILLSLLLQGNQLISLEVQTDCSLNTKYRVEFKEIILKIDHQNIQV